MYVGVYEYLLVFHEHIQAINAKQSLHYTHTQINSASKVGFFPELETWRSDYWYLMTSRLALLVNFSGILPKPYRLPGKMYLVVWKVGVTHIYAYKN